MREHTQRNTNVAKISAAALWALLPLALAGCVPATQEEVAMGNSYAQQIERELPIIRDPDIVRYINVLGDSIARVSDDRSLTWRFSVVDQAEINAFAVPGGHIYVYRGLIEKMTNMSELAGVLGHEIAHVTQRHGMQQMAKAQRANIGMTGLCLFVPSACQGVAGAVVQVGAEGLHGCGEDPCPWRASVGGDPVTYLVVRCAVALGGPGVGCGTGKVPDTSFCDSVGQGEDVVVDGGAVSFGGDEDEGAV